MESNSQILGSATFRENMLPVIRLFAGHNVSTLRHELTHVMRKNLAASAKRPNARPETVRRYAALEREFGVKDGNWTVEQEEAFAKAFERYLLDGKAPAPALAEAFETIRQGMEDVYSSVDALGLEMSSEAREFFNSMMTVPIAEGKWQFQRALANIADGEWARPEPLGDPVPPRQEGRLPRTPEQVEQINTAADRVQLRRKLP